jgi:hypothetical protein
MNCKSLAQECLGISSSTSPSRTLIRRHEQMAGHLSPVIFIPTADDGRRQRVGVHKTQLLLIPYRPEELRLVSLEHRRPHGENDPMRGELLISTTLLLQTAILTDAEPWPSVQKHYYALCISLNVASEFTLASNCLSNAWHLVDSRYL